MLVLLLVELFAYCFCLVWFVAFQICRSHASTGICDYGSTCQFAHGMGELRSREVDTKYKTELCKNYHSQGPQNCWYGSRCKFVRKSQQGSILQ